MRKKQKNRIKSDAIVITIIIIDKKKLKFTGNFIKTENIDLFNEEKWL